MVLIHLILKHFEKMVPLKYLSKFWRTLEMLLINCEVELILTWSSNCAIIYTDVANRNPTFTITVTNLLLYQLKTKKVLPKSKSGFKRIVSWNKYLAKPELLPQNPNLNQLIETSFQRTK